MYTPPPPVNATHLTNSNLTFKSKFKHQLPQALGHCPGSAAFPGSHLTLFQHSNYCSACPSNYKAFDPWHRQNDWCQSLALNEAKKNRLGGDRAVAGKEEKGRTDSAEDRRQQRSTEARGSRCPLHRDSDARSCLRVLLVVIKTHLITEPQSTITKKAKVRGGAGQGRWSLLKHLSEDARKARPQRSPQRRMELICFL